MSLEDQMECPLCMEPFDLDDVNFFPCQCGYQICRFCWHRLRMDENGLCPACRQQYSEDPAVFKPLTDEELHRIKKERRQKDLQRKQKAAENRKHLANVRVVQRNLVFVVGLSQRLADHEVLKRSDYFGKYGKIHKVVINQSTSYAGAQGPSASAYVTYIRSEDALRAIGAVNNIHVDGRTLKASLGTTKYCSHFLRGSQCPKPDCMYLHELGEEAASFTKEEMQQGKHQEYEQRLQEQFMNSQNITNSLQNTVKTPQMHRKSGESPHTIGSDEDSLGLSDNSGSPGLVEGSPPSLHGSAGWPTLMATTQNSNGPTIQPLVPGDLYGQADLLAVTTGSTTTTTLDTTNSYHHQNNHNHHHSNHHLPHQQHPSHTSHPAATGPHHQHQHSGASSSSSSSNASQNSGSPVDLPCDSPPHSSNSGSIQQPPSASSIHQHLLQQQQQANNNPATTTTAQALPPHNNHQQLNSKNIQAMSLAAGLSGLSISSLPGSAVSGSSSTTSASTTSSGAPVAPTMRSANSYLDGGVDNSMSLFSGNGFSTPSVQAAQSARAAQHQHNHKPTDHPAIPDVLPVSHANTDWSAAFGFGNASVDTQDDDLGFDPWNESSKALADLIEKENGSSILGDLGSLGVGSGLGGVLGGSGGSSLLGGSFPPPFPPSPSEPPHHAHPQHLHHRSTTTHTLQSSHPQHPAHNTPPPPPGLSSSLHHSLPNGYRAGGLGGSAGLGGSNSNSALSQSQPALANGGNSTGGAGGVPGSPVKCLPPGFSNSPLTNPALHGGAGVGAPYQNGHVNPGVTRSKMLSLMQQQQQQQPSSVPSGGFSSELDAVTSRQSLVDPHHEGWQDGLRALLPPNINLSFGSSLPSQQQALAMQDRQQQQQKMWSDSGSFPQEKDIPSDPAIVTQASMMRAAAAAAAAAGMGGGHLGLGGGLDVGVGNPLAPPQHAGGLHHGAGGVGGVLGDDTPHWMASLHNLTDDSGNTHTRLPFLQNFTSNNSSATGNSSNVGGWGSGGNSGSTQPPPGFHTPTPPATHTPTPPPPGLSPLPTNAPTAGNASANNNTTDNNSSSTATQPQQNSQQMLAERLQ